jgi:CitMHS family citrate-Mg2+:H+ or citrate-Ca2+:H+ symporter
MTDAGMFDKIINALMKRVGSNVIGVAVMTCIIAIIGHLDGGGASTFLITIPAMLPVYKRLHMRRTTLLLICVCAMGVMNLVPWGGPTMRAASVLGMDANDLWRTLMPMQAVGIVLAFATAIIWGILEKKNIAKLGDKAAEEDDSTDVDEVAAVDNTLARPKFFVFNLLLTLVVVLCLVFLPVPSYFVFMVGCVLALFVNYSGAKLQGKIIKSHSGPALMMASTILAAGVFLGVLEQSGIMDHMANVLASFIPASMGHFLPLIIGVLSVPLTLLFCTDSYFYGLLPVLISIGNAFGVNPVHTAVAMVVCRNCATFISPVVPATFLGVGLAGVEIKDHIKKCFFWVWGVSLICLVSGIILGVIRF